MIVENLVNPVAFLNVSATKIAWRIQYPGNQTYWVLQDENDRILMEGNYHVDDSIVELWGDDSVISSAIITAEPWLVI